MAVQETYQDDEAIRDPACGIDVECAHSRFMAKQRGERFFFCSGSCLEKFKRAPEAYLADRAPAESVPEGTLYICPMGPEVVRYAPDGCPICGMALKPMTPNLDEAPNPELVDFKRRLLDRCALGARRAGARYGRPSRHSLRALAGTDGLSLAASSPRDAGGALDRRPLLQARLGVDRQSQPEHVDPDRHRRRRRFRVQHYGPAVAKPVSSRDSS